MPSNLLKYETVMRTNRPEKVLKMWALKYSLNASRCLITATERGSKRTCKHHSFSGLDWDVSNA